MLLKSSFGVLACVIVFAACAAEVSVGGGVGGATAPVVRVVFDGGAVVDALSPVCDGGRCASHTACDDGNECTLDYPAGVGCVHVEDTSMPVCPGGRCYRSACCAGCIDVGGQACVSACGVGFVCGDARVCVPN